MDLSLVLIYGFLLHLIGDYIIQNDWMATNKKNKNWEGLLACLTHCLTYSLPFIFISNWSAVLMIFGSHYIIDRYHLIEWFIALKNGGDPKVKLGFSPDRPLVLTLWLYIITDNVFHLIGNAAILYYCFAL